jgi:hypothetical protein
MVFEPGSKRVPSPGLKLNGRSAYFSRLVDEDDVLTHRHHQIRVNEYRCFGAGTHVAGLFGESLEREGSLPDPNNPAHP